MFCPECKAEYRPGFTHCSGCDVYLVEELSESQTDVNSRKLGSVRAGKDEERCMSLCEQFATAGIPYKVDQRWHQYLRGLDENYKIAVRPELFDKAKNSPQRTRLRMKVPAKALRRS